MIIYGINPTLEALGAGAVTAVRVVSRRSKRLAALLDRAERAGVTVRVVESAELDRAAGGGVHQGVVAEVVAPCDFDVRGLVAGAMGTPLIVVLDGVEDPQNFGAIVRTADAAGVDGIVRQTRRAAPTGAAAAKASAGALAHARLAPVVNISRALTELKAEGVWVVGLDAEARQPYDTVDLTVPIALVVGAEGTGLRRLVRERCDWLVSIPMCGAVSSLNVSVATGIAIFEVLRQRRANKA